jgi:glycerol-3-phosphate acyltransferase PlsX
MGAMYARVGLGIETPRIGLLSIGEEETKGNELTREAHQRLKASALAFIGNVEAQAIFAGDADVVVCDGFTGNVALKLSEGLVEWSKIFSGEELQSTFSSQVGYLLSRRRSGGFASASTTPSSAARRCSASPVSASSATADRP